MPESETGTRLGALTSLDYPHSRRCLQSLTKFPLFREKHKEQWWHFVKILNPAHSRCFFLSSEGIYHPRRYISPPAVLEHECTDNTDNLTCGEDDGSAFREESECVGRNEQQLYPARHPDRGPHPQGRRKRRKRLEPPGTKQRLTEVQLKKNNLSARKSLVARK